MTPKQIKRAKRLAEILGMYDSTLELMSTLESKHHEYARNATGSAPNPYRIKTFEEIFQPEQDKALLWDLQVKYGVQINMHYYQCVIIDYPSSDWGDTEIAGFSFKNESEIPAAIIDCVIKINGGHDE